MRNGLGSTFQLKETILDFLTKFAQKEFFQSKTEKSEHRHRILQIRISQCIKIHFEQKNLNFWSKLNLKGFFWSKKEKVSVIVDFYIFELGKVPNFT